MKKIGVGIAGGTGYGAHELLRLLKNHPSAEVCSITSRSEANKKISAFHSDLHGVYDLTFKETLDIDALSAYEEKVVFTALPHGASIEYIDSLLSNHTSLRIIDLSGDLRLTSEAVHYSHYADTPFKKELREQFTYGMTELNRNAICAARHIANPGCYPTAASLSLAPLADNGLIAGTVVVNAASGTSGAGRSPGPATHHPQRNASITAYKALEHRHEAEIHQSLGDPDCQSLQTMFVPHLLPVSRGIYISAYTELTSAMSQEELLATYKDFYKDDMFVRVLPAAPELAAVIGSNFCDISLSVRDKQIAIFAAEDNLIKGMAGQAIQNMNLMLGLDETEGLSALPFGIL